MHEYSIVQALLDQCAEIAHNHQAHKITKVIVKIGRMSGVEPHLLDIAFHTFKEDTVCDQAELCIDIQPVVIRCKQCRNETVLEEIAYCCQVCESLDVVVIDGEEMYLMSLEME